MNGPAPPCGGQSQDDQRYPPGPTAPRPRRQPGQDERDRLHHLAGWGVVRCRCGGRLGQLKVTGEQPLDVRTPYELLALGLLLWALRQSLRFLQRMLGVSRLGTLIIRSPVELRGEEPDDLDFLVQPISPKCKHQVGSDALAVKIRLVLEGFIEDDAARKALLLEDAEKGERGLCVMGMMRGLREGIRQDPDARAVLLESFKDIGLDQRKVLRIEYSIEGQLDPQVAVVHLRNAHRPCDLNRLTPPNALLDRIQRRAIHIRRRDRLG